RHTRPDRESRPLRSPDRAPPRRLDHRDVESRARRMAYHVRRSAPCAERDRSLHQQRLRPGHRRRVVSAAAQTDTEDRDMVSGRGNAAAVETTERFPPRLGSRWRTRDSHIPTADPHHHRNEERTEDWTAPTRSGTLTARQTNGNSGGKV